LVQLTLGCDTPDFFLARIAKYVPRAIGLSIRNRDHPHSGYAVGYLVCETLGHETRADNSHTDRLSVCFACLQGVVDEYHVILPWTEVEASETMPALAS
jgi:hypothetical protein